MEKKHGMIKELVFISMSSNKETLIASFEVAIEEKSQELYQFCANYGARIHKLESSFKQTNMEFMEKNMADCPICHDGLDLTHHRF